jgi:hypothetical protein
VIGDRRDPVTNARRAVRRTLDELPNNLKLWRMVGEIAVKGAQSRLRSRSGTAAPVDPAPVRESPVGESVDPTVGRVPSTPTTLPIPDYDDLSASQVRERLPALDAAQRARIADHERHHRSRTTILDAIARLDAATPGG